MSALTLTRTDIPGLLVLHLPVHHDHRGWFKENWNRRAMRELGLPDFDPVQHNVSHNSRRGVTRGFHAEPWDKFVSVVTGRALGAWVDLRPGASHGRTHQLELDATVAVFVPRGVANAYQTLEDDTSYSYLVNAHWTPGATYPALSLADAHAGVAWPIPLAEAEVSEKDLANPAWDQVLVPTPRVLVIGAQGQAGRALVAEFPGAHGVDLGDLDVRDPHAVAAWPWADYEVVVNAAAFTDVDAAEHEPGRSASWAANATAPGLLAAMAREHRFTLVHFSTDYVFDGQQPEHTEEEPLSPLGYYAHGKAAGDLAVAGTPRHYLIRTSWLVGEGRNFVRTMQEMATNGVSPQVVDDQFGRLTFAHELARATRHLVDANAPFGTYNVTNAGPVTSWAEIARTVFAASGRSADDVTPVSSQEYAAGREVAPRPRHSALDLTKLRAAGFEPEDATSALQRWLAQRP